MFFVEIFKKICNVDFFFFCFIASMDTGSIGGEISSLSSPQIEEDLSIPK